MVSSRHRSSAAAAAAAAAVSATSAESATTTTASTTTSNTLSNSKVIKQPLDDWTTKEKLYLTSLAIKHGNAWNSVSRNMQSTFEDQEKPEGWSNQKNCAAQFEKLMNELGVDKRPKRNEPSDGNSSSVIYKKVSEKRCKELEESIKELRKLWLAATNNLKDLDREQQSSADPAETSSKQKSKSTSTTAIATNTTSSSTSNITTSTLSTRNSTRSSTASESEKPPTRALTRRESSRQNLEKTLAILCKEASEIKGLNLMTKPAQESEREYYDQVILKPMDLTIVKQRLGSEVDDPYSVMNDLLLMFQNATMFYPPEHHIYKTAVELRDKLVPQWEKALLDRFKAGRH